MIQRLQPSPDFFGLNADGSPDRRRFAKKLARDPEAQGGDVNVAGGLCCDFPPLLAGAVESEKSFEPEPLGRAPAHTRDDRGLGGTLSFSATHHSGISVDDLVQAAMSSGRGARAMKVFREQAK